MANIQYVPPTTPPDLLSSAFSQGMAAGAQAGRNKAEVIVAQVRAGTAMAEIAMRERIAQTEAALSVRELDARERMALMDQKQEMNIAVMQIGESREAREESIAFDKEQLVQRHAFAKELLGLDPERATSAKKLEILNARDELFGKLERGEIDDKQLLDGLRRFTESADEWEKITRLRRSMDLRTGEHPTVDNFMNSGVDTDTAGRLTSAYHQALTELNANQALMMSLNAPDVTFEMDQASNAWQRYTLSLGVVNSLRRQGGMQTMIPDEFTRNRLSPNFERQVFSSPPAAAPVESRSNFLSNVGSFYENITPQWYRDRFAKEAAQRSGGIAPRGTNQVTINPAATHTVKKVDGKWVFTPVN